jgi:hypothetical protein
MPTTLSAKRPFSHIGVRVKWKNDPCQLLGRGYYPDERRWHPSACGVWLDGKRMPAGGELIFSPGREYRVTLAEAEAEKPAAYELSVQLAVLLPIGDYAGERFRIRSSCAACTSRLASVQTK